MVVVVVNKEIAVVTKKSSGLAEAGFVAKVRKLARKIWE